MVSRLLVARCSFAFGIALAATSLLASELVDVEQGGLRTPGRRGSKLTGRVVQDSIRTTAFQVTWKPEAKRLAELYVNDRPPIYAFGKGVVVSIPVNAGAFPGFQTIGVRVIDVNGEIWQWGTKVKSRLDQWQTAEISLNKPDSSGHWGGRETGRDEIDAPVRLLSIVAMAPNVPTEARSIRIGSITRNAFDESDIEPAFLLQDVEASLALPDLPIRMVTPETRDNFGVTARNSSDRVMKFRLAVTLTSAEGEVTRWNSRRAVTLRPGQSFRRSLADLLDSFGWWNAQVTVTSEDQTASVTSDQTAFVYIDPTGPRKHPPTEGFWFGIDARFKDATADEWQVEACSLIGADYLRAGLTWPRIQSRGPESGSWTRHRLLLDLVQKHGMKTSYGLSFTPKWAVRYAHRNEPQTGSFPPRPEPWRRFVAEVAQFNREHGVVSYEIWNEPDLFGFWKGTTDEYLETLRIAHEELEKHHPEATVISGGMATVLGHGGQHRNPQLIERTIVGHQDHYEAIGHHEHGTFDRFVRALTGPMAGYRKQLRRDKPLWFTETGYHGNDSKDGLHQAATMVKKHAYARSMNTQGFTWFVFKLGNEAGYSMVNQRREPTPTVAAYNAMTRLMRDYRFVRTHDVGADNWAIEFAGRGQHLFVAWSEKAESTGHILPLDIGNNATVTTHDLFGNETDRTRASGVTPLNLTHAVQYVIVNSHQQPRLLAPVARIQNDLYADSGKSVTVRGTLSNPLSQDAKFNVKWIAPNNQSHNESIAVSAGASVNTTFSFTAPDGLKSGETAPVVALHYEIPDTLWKGSATSPLQVAQLIPAEPIDQRPPDFILSTRDHVFNPNENDPTRRELAWSGPNDLSARVWLGLENESLVVRVDARDDQHRAPTEAGKMWQTDSVQFAFTVSGQNGYWEIGVGRQESSAVVHSWATPSGFDDPVKVIAARATPTDNGSRYVARLPLKNFGLTRKLLTTTPIRFNLIVNDDDLGQREGWVEVAPHLGQNKNPNLFPSIRFESD